MFTLQGKAWFGKTVRYDKAHFQDLPGLSILSIPSIYGNKPNSSFLISGLSILLQPFLTG